MLRQGMRLERLNIGTQISDLSPLAGMPLTFFRCYSIKVTDFSLLKGMPLTQLDFDFKPERDTELIRSLKKLEIINNKPAAEFWKEVERKSAAKKPLAFE